MGFQGGELLNEPQNMRMEPAQYKEQHWRLTEQIVSNLNKK